MFILYHNKVVDYLPNVRDMTCKQVHSILTGSNNDSEREKIGRYDVMQKSIKVQRTAKRCQLNDGYYNHLKQSGWIQ